MKHIKYRIYKKLSNRIENYGDYVLRKSIQGTLAEILFNPYFRKFYNLKKISRYINQILKNERKVKNMI